METLQKAFSSQHHKRRGHKTRRGDDEADHGAGATMDNIVDEMMLLTDMDDCMANVNEVFGARQKAYGKKPDATQTMVAVAALMLPALKVEIKVVAHL